MELELICGISAEKVLKVAIDRAKDRLQRESLSADFVVGDMMNLPWTDNYFDVVIDIEAIYANTLKDSKIILSEINRILKPSGLFYSKSVSDRIYKGKNYSTVAHNEYSLASDGPLANLEIARVMSKKDVYELYGDYFKVEALDLAEVTRDNDSYLVSEWLIRCAKKT